MCIRLKKDHEQEILKLKSVLEAQNKKITQLERENRDFEESVVQKVSTVHGQLRGNQEHNYRCTINRVSRMC